MKDFRKKAVALVLAALAPFILVSCASTPYDYELDEYITLGDYTQIKIDEEQVTARAEQYKTELLLAHSKKSPEPISGRHLRAGDIAVISYKCYTEEELATHPNDPSLPAALEDSECELIIGSGKFLPAIEAAILNADLSSTTLEVYTTIPEDFGLTDIAGKSVMFYLTINTAYELISPEYNDKFISENTRYTTVLQYESAMLEQARRQLVWDALIEQSTVLAYPKEELSEHTLDFIEYYTNQATAASLTLEQFVARKFFIELNTFHLRADEYSKRYTKEELAVYSISKKNGLDLTDQEYTQAASKYASEYGYASLSEYEYVYGRAFIRYSILKDKVMDYVTKRSLSPAPPTE